MQRFWLTTHWPPLPSGPDTLHIYLQHGHKPALADMTPGDRVLIYEYTHGPSLLKPDGSILRRKKGRGGIICDARVASPLQRQPPHLAHETHTTGRKFNWAWTAQTDDRTFGFVDRDHLNQVLGFKETNQFHGFNKGRLIQQLPPQPLHHPPHPPKIQPLTRAPSSRPPHPPNRELETPPSQLGTRNSELGTTSVSSPSPSLPRSILPPR